MFLLHAYFLYRIHFWDKCCFLTALPCRSKGSYVRRSCSFQEGKCGTAKFLLVLMSAKLLPFSTCGILDNTVGFLGFIYEMSMRISTQIMSQNLWDELIEYIKVFCKRWRALLMEDINNINWHQLYSTVCKDAFLISLIYSSQPLCNESIILSSIFKLQKVKKERWNNLHKLI